MKLRECFEKRLLRRKRPDFEKSKRSIEVAEAKLDEAEEALSHKLFDATIILAYTAMFHAAKSTMDSQNRVGHKDSRDGKHGLD